jgi:hypothetical protein
MKNMKAIGEVMDTITKQLPSNTTISQENIDPGRVLIKLHGNREDENSFVRAVRAMVTSMNIKLSVQGRLILLRHKVVSAQALLKDEVAVIVIPLSGNYAELFDRQIEVLAAVDRFLKCEALATFARHGSKAGVKMTPQTLSWFRLHVLGMLVATALIRLPHLDITDLKTGRRISTVRFALDREVFISAFSGEQHVLARLPELTSSAPDFADLLREVVVELLAAAIVIVTEEEVFVH